MQRGETVLAFFSVVAISTNPSTVNNGANVIKKSEGQKVEGLKVRNFSPWGMGPNEQTNIRTFEVRTVYVFHYIDDCMIARLHDCTIA
jgi:hypothetical protein